MGKFLACDTADKDTATDLEVCTIVEEALNLLQNKVNLILVKTFTSIDSGGPPIVATVAQFGTHTTGRQIF